MSFHRRGTWPHELSELISYSYVIAFVVLWSGLFFVLAHRLKIAILLALLSIAYAVHIKLIEPLALLTLILLASATALCIRFYGNSSRVAYEKLFILLLIFISLGVGFHAFEGFNNPIIVDKAVVSQDAISFTLFWNYDKAVLAFCLILFFKSTSGQLNSGHLSWFTTLIALLTTIVICLTLAVSLGLIRWDPKVPEFFIFWVLSNLLITSAAEEAFFRGIIQFQLQRRLIPVTPHADIIAIGAAGTLFGVAHFAMGTWYVAVAIAAGIGYGLVFYLSGRIEASILAHFLLNATHILLFTYPILAQT